VAFNWDGIETQRKPAGASCAGATYGGFGRYDGMVAEGGARGIKLLPVLFGSPEYVEGGDFSNMPRTGTRAMGDYICYVRALVERYGRGGSFPAQTGAQPITEWQVWNEENLPTYAAGGQISPAEYGRFVKQTAAAIRGIDPRATIVLGGVPERSRNGMNAERYLRELYSVRQIESYFQVVALHPYAENALGVKGALIRMRDMLARVGDPRQVIWLTEVGYASHGPEGHFLVNSEEGQARKLADTMHFVRNNHERYKVGTVHWFNWRDTAPYGSGGPWSEFAGLYRFDRSPKPACNAYARFTGGVRPCQSIPVPESAPTASTGLDAGTQQVLPSPPATGD
jgi:hypothetical protein